MALMTSRSFALLRRFWVHGSHRRRRAGSEWTEGAELPCDLDSERSRDPGIEEPRPGGVRQGRHRSRPSRMTRAHARSSARITGPAGHRLVSGVCPEPEGLGAGCPMDPLTAADWAWRANSAHALTANKAARAAALVVERLHRREHGAIDLPALEPAEAVRQDMRTTSLAHAFRCPPGPSRDLRHGRPAQSRWRPMIAPRPGTVEGGVTAGNRARRPPGLDDVHPAQPGPERLPVVDAVHQRPQGPTGQGQ
jgi:hypothetical protein